MKIEFHGAVGTVTGSQFLVHGGDRRVLVDCGMFQGSPEETARNRMPFSYPPGSLDAVLLTHAHLDHCGRLPALVAAGYTGPFYATAATADLAAIVLRDSAKLQEEFAKRWERRHRGDRPQGRGRRGGSTRRRERRCPRKDSFGSSRGSGRDSAPPSTASTMSRRPSPASSLLPTTRQSRVAPGISAVFHDAGHILGSAMIELRLDGTPCHQHRLLR